MLAEEEIALHCTLVSLGALDYTSHMLNHRRQRTTDDATPHTHIRPRTKTDCHHHHHHHLLVPSFSLTPLSLSQKSKVKSQKSIVAALAPRPSALPLFRVGDGCCAFDGEEEDEEEEEEDA